MKKRITVLLLALLVLLALASCGAENSMDKGYAEEDRYDGNYKDDVLTENGTGVGEKGEIQDQSAKIIRNVTIRGESKDFDGTVDTVSKQVKEHGGYIESSDIRGGKSYEYKGESSRTATYVIRIPSDKLDSFLAKTKGAINVTSSSESTEDVTLDYYDIQARLDTLKSKKASLEKMLEAADNLDDMLKIQENLYQVIADIEAYQSRLNLYDNKVSYSTVNLTVDEVVEYTEETEPTFGERISKAFGGGWSAFAKAMQNIAVAAVYLMPLIVIALIGGAVFLVIYFVRKKKGK